MPLAATWMNLEIIILSEVSQMEKDISYNITYMWNLKENDTNELIYKREADSQTQRTDLWLPRPGQGEGWSRSLGLADASYYAQNG